MNQGHRWVRFMKKTGGKKSRATVSLILSVQQGWFDICTGDMA
jgi:hypothetical protein